MNYPHHIAVIADGNRTRAKEKGLTPMDGHLEGAKNAIALVKHLFNTTPIKVFTGWFLSTENMTNRSETELGFIFGIFKLIGNDLDDFMIEHQISFRRVGSPVGLPDDFLTFLTEKQKKFSFSTDKAIVFAINYGGRDEILRGIKNIPQNTDLQSLTEADFSSYLDFGALPPVDLVIRTKGDVARRTSGFMARRIGYAELYFSEKKFPDLDFAEITKILGRFDSVSDQRNFGK
ncbi:MAG TPA: undecaprenyl diphosphate synthase family protein [Candidatus Absconditabacterales bacterium]|nr:undecaprenyl diphosphate synthase family protein [Candidatus Absconditabacterales bacterium]